jgi:hypothetical protein
MRDFTAWDDEELLQLAELCDEAFCRSTLSERNYQMWSEALGVLEEREGQVTPEHYEIVTETDGICEI